MTNEGVTIDISYYPGGQTVKQDGGGYYYESTGGTVLLTDEWYPDPEGTYRKFTHTPENGKIGNIMHNKNSLSGFGSFADKKSVSVYYWSLDNTCSKPLLIQLGSGNTYYITEGGDGWKNQSDINDTNLRKKLNKQNCQRNQAHVIDLSNKSNGNYTCLSCQKQIQVYSNSYGGTTYYTSRSSYRLSVNSFRDKDVNSWQLGLPSLNGASGVNVYWNGSGRNPLIVYQQVGNQRYFRKNAGNGTSWIEVSNAGSLPNGQTPTITTLDFSSSSGITYDGGSSSISITVLRSHIGEGYYGYQYSLRGAPFMISGVKHNSTPLTGISFQDALTSVSGYYYGGNNPTDQSNILLIEVVASGNSKYSYFYRRTKDADKWAEYSISGGGTTRLQGKGLTQKLDELKELKVTLEKLDKLTELEAELSQLKEKLNESHNTGTVAGSSVGTGLGGAGLGALAVWKGPALIARLITRL
ncbi:hypothetical protein BEWA_033070 [Theileria equi strain WA]|uniref:Uncharacterized protein n=1 Tax=Theileria equi strain WA TaxID=1537102 RepID=L0B007_THEEQ|nr:hypothetical protein BEWA_033070 [Theileria equi strain WA]AFZ80454.1 hypothetical protein BEWA_033070 [Theileria equi strain WA]|eukprot:XP_004830120.1 hypothetical protein BEWA_033070 [Theileria equi strain WA]